MKAWAAGFSSRGSRPYNEDTIFYKNTESGFLAVAADGLGGHGGGAEASALAVQVFSEGLVKSPGLTEENIRGLLDQANSEIRKRQTPSVKMRTTFVAFLCDGESWASVHVGDSRLYWFLDGTLKSRTLDHSVSQMAALAGEIREEQIRFHEDRNKVLRALGGTEQVRPDISIEKGPAGPSAILLCTDGFWEHVWETEMEADLAKSDSPARWLSYMAARIGKRMTGQNDNLSAVAVFIQE